MLELSKPTSICLGAFDDDKLCGHLVCSRYHTVWHLMNVAVEPSYRRLGIANATIGGAVLSALGICAWATATSPWHMYPAALLTGAGWAVTSVAAINAMIAAESMTGIDNHHVTALPHDQLKAVLKRYNRLRQ